MSQGIFDPSPNSRYGGPLLSATCELPLGTEFHPCQATQAQALRLKSPVVIVHVKRKTQELDIKFLVFPSGCQLTQVGLNHIQDLMIGWHASNFYVAPPRTYYDPYRVRWAGLGLIHLLPILRDIRRIGLNRATYFMPRLSPLQLVTNRPDGPPDGAAA